MHRKLAKAHAIIAAQRRKMEEADVSPYEGEASSEEEWTVRYNSPSLSSTRLFSTPAR